MSGVRRILGYHAANRGGQRSGCGNDGLWFSGDRVSHGL